MIKQQGIALITVLLVVALATIITTTMATRQQLDIHRTANIINQDQAYLYALGGEYWVKRILLRDKKQNKIDSFQDIWSMPVPPLPIPEGSIQGQIEDLQGRFNLNNLVKAGQVSIEDKIFFEHLLDILELPPSLSQAIIDWIDKDTEIQMPYGAEDNVYLIQTPAYRTANTLFSSTTELNLLTELSYKHYEILQPYITALPMRTKINVNTAPLMIFMALATELTETNAQILIAERERKPYQSVQSFMNHNVLAGLTIANIELAVKSNFFLFKSQVQIDKTQTKLNSLLHRQANQVKTIMRN
ncbi:MAG: type II secretion system minor pseudopilin GspK [Thiomargarita sp.]|nr:type II secretion system minor pseudopilin GspK [Thiomargarita sp.]